MNSPKITSRSASLRRFFADGRSATHLSMSDALNKLIVQYLNENPSTDPEYTYTSKTPTNKLDLTRVRGEMDDFLMLFERYLLSKSEPELDWSAIQSIDKDFLIEYASLESTHGADESNEQLQQAQFNAQSMHDNVSGLSGESTDSLILPAPPSHPNLSRLAVLKLNGGLGTTMGCTGPKSALEVRDGMTFLDLIVRQIEVLNRRYHSDVPLILMNSFNTDCETSQIIRKYANHRINIQTFNQSRFPRIYRDSLLPVPETLNDDGSAWYPPGHGDLLNSLCKSGILDKLLERGQDILFISNVDNLGATVDLKILSYMVNTGAEFIMEVTDKTRSDIKGGTLVNYNGQIQLLELAQVPTEHVKEFTSISTFKVFNTNNVWINLRALKNVLQQNLELDIIVNNKKLPSGKAIIQLETAVGAAIKHFRNVVGVNVPRSRFFPVKSCADLFLIHSNLFTISHGILQYNPLRGDRPLPLIKLGEHFKMVDDYLERVASPPKILDLDHLTINGDVTIGSDTSLKGTVIIVAKTGSHIDIPSGSILHDKVVTGDLWIADH